MLVVKQMLPTVIVVLVHLVLFPEVLDLDNLPVQLQQLLLLPIKIRLQFPVLELVDHTMVKVFILTSCIIELSLLQSRMQVQDTR